MTCTATTLAVTTSLIGLLLGLAVFYWKRFRANHYWKTKGISCEEPVPLLGNFYGMFFKDTKKCQFEWDHGCYKKFGRIFGAYFMSRPVLFVGEPELIKQILVKDFQANTDRRVFKLNNDIIENFLSQITGENWKRVRSVITPAFSTGKLKKMSNLIKECADTSIVNFTTAAESGKSVDCKSLFGGYTLDVIASSAFGTKLNSVEDPQNIFVQKAKKVFGFDFDWKVITLVLLREIFQGLNMRTIVFAVDELEFFKELTLSIIERREKTNEVRDDLLNALLEAQKRKSEEDSLQSTKGNSVRNAHRAVENEDSGELPQEDENYSFFKDYAKNKSISKVELVAQCVMFFVAGYETTATTLSMIAYYLAQYPECQEKLVREVDEIKKKHSVFDLSVLSEMKYTDAVISEALRLAPPAPRLERTAVEDYVLGDTGIIVSKGMVIGIPIYAMHHDPEFFPNPELFDPDRFLPENKDLIQPYSYLPFGAGPRNCLGMRFALAEIKMLILKIFGSFTFEVCPETKIPLDLRNGSGLFLPREVMLRVVKRNVSI